MPYTVQIFTSRYIYRDISFPSGTPVHMALVPFSSDGVRAADGESDVNRANPFVNTLCTLIPYPVLARYLTPREVGQLARTCRSFRRAILDHHWWSIVLADNADTPLVNILCGQVPYPLLLRFLGPRDLARLSATCRRIRSTISDEWWLHLPQDRVIDQLARVAAKRDISPERIPLRVFELRVAPTSVHRSILVRRILPWLCRHGCVTALRVLCARSMVTPQELHGDDDWILEHACKYGPLSIVRCLFEELGFTVADARRNQSAAFFYACGGTGIDTVRYLVETVGLTPADMRVRPGLALFVACSHENCELVHYLLAEGRLTVHDVRGNDNETLVAACASGNLVIVRALFELGHLTLRDVHDQLLCLMNEICERGHLAVLQYLCTDIGLTQADVRVGSNTPLSTACIFGHLTIVEYLCEGMGLSRADVCDADCSSFYCACTRDRVAVVRYFVEKIGITRRDIGEHNVRAILPTLLSCRHDDTILYLTAEAKLFVATDLYGGRGGWLNTLIDRLSLRKLQQLLSVPGLTVADLRDVERFPAIDQAKFTKKLAGYRRGV
jgi:hypothetical protein